MSEVKALLWWNLGQTTMIITVLFFLLEINKWVLYYMTGVAILNTIIGIIEFFKREKKR